MNIDRSNRSPHHRPRTSPVKGVLIHYTGGPGAIAWMCRDASGVSAHYHISRGGLVSELVSPSRRASHAGIGEMNVDGETLSNPNDFTIGIELDNHGWLYRDQHGNYWWETKRGVHRYDGPEPEHAVLMYDDNTEFDGYWEPYPEAQLEALEELLGYLIKEGYHDAVANLVGHEEVAMPMGRKRDPGPLFPWERFERTTARRTWCGTALEEPSVVEDDDCSRLSGR